MIERALKDGEVKFCEGKREEDKAKAYKLLGELEEAEHYDFEIITNSFGYIVRRK